MFGMAHRGRLNALHCVRKPAQQIFREFLEKSRDGDSEQNEFAGDVKYQFGLLPKEKVRRQRSGDANFGQPLLTWKPSILSSTVLLVLSTDEELKNKVLGVVIHGDAAIAGQGVVYESI